MYGRSASAKLDDHFSNVLVKTLDDIQTEAYNPQFALTKGLLTKRKLRIHIQCRNHAVEINIYLVSK